MDPEVLLYRLRPLQSALQDAQWNTRLTKRLINTITVVAVFLAAIGLFGVFAHAVVQREREIAIRKALGARSSAIARAVARRAAMQLVLGIAAGSAAAWAFERALRLGGDPFGYRLSDPVTLTMAGVLLAAVTAIASALPAYRAARLEPVRVLQS
jgi:ABC-type antimicrobial peptide transport system permease subunit